MKHCPLLSKGLFVVCGFFLSPLIVSNSLLAQTSKEIILKNNTEKVIRDYTLEIPVKNLGLSIGTYVAKFNNEVVPVEISQDIHDNQKVIIPINRAVGKEEMKITIEKGSIETYPKRAYAELSHKIGGELINNKYVGDNYSWVRVNQMTLPGSFRDHAYYIKYEGPGWENDKVAFRLYLDNRNAIDVFGKTTSDIVLPAVGVDGYDNYHKYAPWGMDNMKVGKALGIGTIAIWDGEKTVRVEERDSTTCIIQADGKIRSQIKTIYHGWNANGTKCNLTSLISIDAGSRASHMELLTDKKIDNIATGIVKIKGAELIVKNDKDCEWSYIATFGQQSLNKDMQGLAIFVKTKNLKEITEDELNHVVIIAPENNYTEYYFMPTWELDKEPVKTKEQFMMCIEEVMNRLNNNINITIKK